MPGFFVRARQMICKDIIGPEMCDCFLSVLMKQISFHISHSLTKTRNNGSVLSFQRERGREKKCLTRFDRSKYG